MTSPESKLRLWTTAEVSQQLRVSAKTLKRWVEAGLFPPPICVGPQTRRWSVTQVEAWVEGRQSGLTNQTK